MKQNKNHYVAKDGNFIVRKKDNFIMGKDIYLGENDSIDNYTEKPYTEESYAEFYKKYGVKNVAENTSKSKAKNK